jgi:hypothetical protein
VDIYKYSEKEIIDIVQAKLASMGIRKTPKSAQIVNNCYSIGGLTGILEYWLRSTVNGLPYTTVVPKNDQIFFGNLDTMSVLDSISVNDSLEVVALYWDDVSTDLLRNGISYIKNLAVPNGQVSSIGHNINEIMFNMFYITTVGTSRFSYNFNGWVIDL